MGSSLSAHIVSQGITGVLPDRSACPYIIAQRAPESNTGARRRERKPPFFFVFFFSVENGRQMCYNV
jgi:hypothetical protein